MPFSSFIAMPDSFSSIVRLKSFAIFWLLLFCFFESDFSFRKTFFFYLFSWAWPDFAPPPPFFVPCFSFFLSALTSTTLSHSPPSFDYFVKLHSHFFNFITLPVSSLSHSLTPYPPVPLSSLFTYLQLSLTFIVVFCFFILVSCSLFLPLAPHSPFSYLRLPPSYFIRSFPPLLGLSSVAWHRVVQHN